MHTKRQPVVHYFEGLEEQKYVGKLYGYYRSDSNQYLVTNQIDIATFFPSYQPPYEIGEIVDNSSVIDSSQEILRGIATETGLVFKVGKKTCEKEPYILTRNIFSRNTSLLETDIMLKKWAIISGLGSVGSLVALELAKTGVGNFLLIDQDTLGVHNICRHQCGLLDVGQFKVNAVKEKILQINPTANVIVYTDIIERVPQRLLDEACTDEAIIIGCADNREGDIYANSIASNYNIPFVSIGLWERAFAGELFYSIPGAMPCYSCPFGKNNGLSNRTSTNRRVYVTRSGPIEVNFEPGISTDINFVTLIGVKLIIDLFNKDTLDYIPKVINYLSQFTLVCNTNDTRIGGDLAEIFTHPLQITQSVTVEYEKPCPPCKILTSSSNYTGCLPTTS